jgi:hypothetical protein
MKRISSSFTLLQKVAGLLFAIGLFAGAYASRNTAVLPPVLFVLGGAAVTFVWLKYVLPATHVLMDENNLYFNRHGKSVTLPLTNLLSVHRPRWVRNPPLLITFQGDDSRPDTIVFIPSFRASGASLFRSELEEILKQAVARNASSSDTSAN